MSRMEDMGQPWSSGRVDGVVDRVGSWCGGGLGVNQRKQRETQGDKVADQGGLSVGGAEGSEVDGVSVREDDHHTDGGLRPPLCYHTQGKHRHGHCPLA